MNTSFQFGCLQAPCFCSFTIVQCADLFTQQAYRDIVVDCMNYCEAHKGLRIHAYVFMSNQIHCILSASFGLLSNILRDMKSFSAKTMFRRMYEAEDCRLDWLKLVFAYAAGGHTRNKDFQIWNHYNHPEELCSEKLFRQKMDFIHNCPIRAGLVAEPHHWLYSSASDYLAGRQVGKLNISLLTLL